jgi:acyl-CoA hydrolase
VVTASIDDVHFVEAIRLGDIVVLKASVNWVGRTSMEVGVRIVAERPDGSRRGHAASAYLTFVAIDRRGRPARLPALLPETAEDRRREREALKRRQRRLALRREILGRHARET